MQIKQVLEKIYSNSYDPYVFATGKLAFNPISGSSNGSRPYSVSFEGAGFGDEGKGLTVVREITNFLKTNEKVVVFRWNGGSNAGHECLLPNGKKIALHQLPMGVLSKGAISVVGRTMVFNPGDALMEKKNIEETAGSFFGKLLIDSNVALSLYTHRALERVINGWLLGYSGSTSRGISVTYADEVLRLKLTMADLFKPDWRGRFGYHYDIVRNWLNAFGFDLEKMMVPTLAKPILIGKKKDFLQRLEEYKKPLAPFVSNKVVDFIDKEWKASTPFVFEGAQAIGLHPKHGVYPDVTSSETRARGIQDATEGVINFNRISARIGVLKGPYMSSVGSRVMPGEFVTGVEVQLREEFNEYGATTGRPRGILPPDMPALQYWRNVSDYEYLAITHMDTSLDKIPVVIGYKDKNGQEVTYRPYQWHLDFIRPEIVYLPGWDGKLARKAKTPKELPENALRFLAFISESLNAKILYATTGPNIDDYVSWI